MFVICADGWETIRVFPQEDEDKHASDEDEAYLEGEVVVEDVIAIKFNELGHPFPISWLGVVKFEMDVGIRRKGTSRIVRPMDGRVFIGVKDFILEREAEIERAHAKMRRKGKING